MKLLNIFSPGLNVVAEVIFLTTLKLKEMLPVICNYSKNKIQYVRSTGNVAILKYNSYIMYSHYLPSENCNR